MKRLFIAVFAMAALAACSKEEAVNIDRGEAIGFGNPFVDNATRAIDPSYNASNLITEFNVWGTVKGNTGNTINLFNGARVYDDSPNYGSAYTCEQEEYWLPSATYNFVAIAGHDHDGVTTVAGMPETISYTADGTTDLIYTKTAKVVTTNAASTPSENPVAFIFNHLLSKVHFAFYNTSATADTVFQISDIKVWGQYTSGTYTIGATTPWAATGALAEADAWSFGNATNSTTDNAAVADITTAFTEASPMTSNYARLLIPGTQTLNISFTKTQYYDGVKMNTEPVEKELTYTFAENGAYVINVELKSGGIIDFSVGSLDGWDDDTSISIP